MAVSWPDILCYRKTHLRMRKAKTKTSSQTERNYEPRRTMESTTTDTRKTRTGAIVEKEDTSGLAARVLSLVMLWSTKCTCKSKTDRKCAPKVLGIRHRQSRQGAFRCTRHQREAEASHTTGPPSSQVTLLHSL